MRIYRVENTRGYGPYSVISRDALRTPREKELLEPMINAHNNCFNGHPMPTEDNISWAMIENESTRYGFSSKEQLKNWFAGYFPVLQQAGYQVVLYRCPQKEVEIGETQIAFPGHLASRIKTLSWKKVESV